MSNFLVISLVTMGWWWWCTLTLARPNAEYAMVGQVLSSANPLYSASSPMLFSADHRPHHRVARSLLRPLDAKKALLLKGRKKPKETIQCCSVEGTGEFIKPELAEQIIDVLADKEKSSLDILLRNNTGPLTLADLMADLSKDTSELNLPEDVQLTNKAIVEALLSKNVLLKFPLTADNGIVIDDHRALVIAFHSGRLKFPLTDSFGRILRDLSETLPNSAKEVLGTLLGGNVVSDILESGTLGLLNYPIKDAKGIPVVDVGSLLFLVVQGGFKNLKFPMANVFGTQLRDDMDLLLLLIDGGFLKNLVYPVRDSDGVEIQSKQAFLKALREGLALKGLKYPIRDSFGITIKRPDALMAALLDDNAARAVGFPLTDAKAAVLKDKLQLFLTLLDGGLSLVTFPLRDAEGNFFKDKLAYLIAVVKALREKQGLDGLLMRSVAAISKFPLTDNAGTTISDKTELLNALLDGQALSGLSFPISDGESNIISNKEDFLRDLVDNGLDSMEYPLTNREDMVFYKQLDVIDALIDGSALMGLKFPLNDKSGRTVKDKEQLLHHIFKRDLRYPLTDCALNDVLDFSELVGLLFDGDALDYLKFPIFDGMGGVFKNKADFLGALIKGGLETLNFPFEDANGNVLKDLENLLESLFDNSILSQLVFPLTDVTGVVFNNKLDFVDSLMGGVLCLPNLNLTDTLGGIVKDMDSFLESLLGGVKLLKFPLTDVSGRTLNNTSDLLDDLMKSSPGLKAIKFPLSDKYGRVLMNKQALLDILPDTNALSALRFPLTDCAGTVFKNKNDFLRRLLKGFTTLNFPLTDGAGLNLPDGKSLLDVLLQAVLTLLTPVLEPMADVLRPVTSLIESILGGNLTVVESLLTNNFNSSSALSFPLSDSVGNNITNQLELFEDLLNGGLMALEFPLTDSSGQVLRNNMDFLEQLINNGPLAELQLPLRNKDGNILGNELSLLTSVVNNNLQAQDFPLTDANNLTINSKLELLTKVLNDQALSRLNYPLIDKNGNPINTKQALLETLLDGGLSSFKYPVFDAGDRVFEDKEALAAILDEALNSANLTDQQTAKPPASSDLDDILKILGDESSLSGDYLALFKAIKEGSIRERDLKDLLGEQKFSVLKEKLAKVDSANALDSLQLTKILDGILELLLQKKPELFTNSEKSSDKSSFT